MENNQNQLILKSIEKGMYSRIKQGIYTALNFLQSVKHLLSEINYQTLKNKYELLLNENNLTIQNIEKLLSILKE